MPTARNDVAHLLRRAGFGGTVAQIDALSAQDLPAIVDGLLNVSGAPADTMPPTLTDTTRSNYQRYVDLIEWWYDRMATTPAPLQEKLTLFWHGHFVSEDRSVDDHVLMYRQNALYRANALGNFRTFCKAMSVEPAMLRYLNNETNRSGKVQENFARELWELFMLGVGNYTQDEVVESARAWTGHGLNSTRDTYVFTPSRHDAGSKTIFGQTYAFDGPDVIDWTLDGPKKSTAAAFIVRKLWTYFAYTNPSQSIVDALASVLSSSWDITATLRALFLRPEFYAPAAQNQLVRSPVEFIVAAMRYSGLTAAQVRPENYQAGMNQELLNPPDVAGWKNNAYWVSAGAFWSRAAFARNVAGQAKAAGLLAGSGSLPIDQAVRAAFDQFGIVNPTATTTAAVRSWLTSERQSGGANEINNLIVMMLLSPDFQVA